MTRDEVRNLMHDYFDDLLSTDERSTVESYLEEFEDIAGEYELLGKLLEKTQTLPIGIKTPDAILEKVSAELLTKSLEKIESDKQKRLRELTENTEKEGEKRKKLKKAKGRPVSSEGITAVKTAKEFPKKPVILFMILIACVAGYFIYDYFNTNSPWHFKLEYGQYQIGPDLSSKKVLDVEEKLTTLDSTKVSINIPNAGRLIVGSYSSIQLIKGKDSDNIILLLAGRIEASCKIDDPRLKIITAAADITAMGGDFSVSVDDQGNVSIQTGNGVVNLANPGEDLLLVQDHKCKILNNGNIGIPYHRDTNPLIVSEVEKISFGKDQIKDYTQVLALATPLDGLTLLYLLKEANNPNERMPLYLKLTELYPPPPGVTQKGILNMDEEMYEIWREDIEWQI